MKKILEYKNNDWLKGISAANNIPSGGLFQIFNGCNPFEQPGLALPSLAPANVVTSGGTISTTPRTLEGFKYLGVPYVYAHSDTKLYQVMVNSPYTITDVTAQIYQAIPFGTPSKMLGKISWKGRYIYAFRTSSGNSYIYSNNYPVASGTDVPIRDAGVGTDYDYVSFAVGADNNCYHNYGQGSFGVLTSATANTENSTTKKIDDQFHVRALINDGRYLVVLADNNSQNISDQTIGSFKCRIYFWDMAQTDGNNYIVPDITWDIDDSYIIGARMLENGIEFMTPKGVYVTNVATRPKIIRPFPATPNLKMGVPLNGYQIASDVSSIYWVDGSHNTYNNIHAYGNPLGGQNIFYNPYTQNVANYLFTCLTVSGNQIIAGCDQPGLFIFNVGSTRGQMQITSIDNNMESPHSYGYTKVVLGQKLQTGQSVQCVVSSNGGGSFISAETQSYDATNPKQSLMFRRVSQAGYVDKFEDITITVSSVGASVQRIATYATPLEDSNTDL